jgi:hypothetical protein
MGRVEGVLYENGKSGRCFIRKWEEWKAFYTKMGRVEGVLYENGKSGRRFTVLLSKRYK